MGMLELLPEEYNCPNCDDLFDGFSCSSCGYLEGEAITTQVGESREELMQKLEREEDSRIYVELENGEKFVITKIGSEKSNVKIDFSFSGRNYRVKVDPQARRKIVGNILIGRVGKYRKEGLVDRSTFKSIVAFVNILCEDPKKYEIDHLKALQKVA